MEIFDEKEISSIFDKYFGNQEYSKDIVKEIKITKQEAKQGVTKSIIINRATPTNTSFKFNKEIENVQIPRNTPHGTIIELAKKGNQYKSNEIRGTLYLKIKIYGK